MMNERYLEGKTHTLRIATGPEAGPPLLLLHGVCRRWQDFLPLIPALTPHWQVHGLDFRGHGGSDDRPGQYRVVDYIEDALAVLHLMPDPAVIYGHSLGGAVAVDLAASLGARGEGAGGLIVESSFTNLADMASEITRGFFPSAMLSQKFDSIGKIAQVRMPVLVVHGQGDRYVPVRFSEALYAAAPTPKRLLLVPNGSHNDSLSVGGSDYRRALVEFFGLGAGGGSLAGAGVGG